MSWRGMTAYMRSVTNATMQNGAVSTFITAPDGLRLHARCYGQRSSPKTPVVCLPGLARTAADFERARERAWRMTAPTRAA